MVVQVLANMRLIKEHLDAVLRQDLLWPNTGEHQQLRSAVGSAG